MGLEAGSWSTCRWWPRPRAVTSRPCLSSRAWSPPACSASMTATLATIALRPAGRLVPAGAVADVVVALDGDELVVVRSRPAGAARRRNLGVGAAWPTATSPRASAPCSRPVPRPTSRSSRPLDEWRVLTAAALVGLARGRARARRRLREGAPAVRRADRVVPGGRSTGWPTSPPRSTAPACSRTRRRGRRRRRARRDRAGVDGVRCSRPRRPQRPPRPRLHVHGGYGFMLEYDIQLYFRRAKAWSLRSATPGGARSARRRARRTGERPPDGLPLGERADAFREEVRAFLRRAPHGPTWSSGRTTPAPCTTGDFHRALGAQGWIAASWPDEYGGQGRDPSR